MWRPIVNLVLPMSGIVFAADETNAIHLLRAVGVFVGGKKGAWCSLCLALFLQPMRLTPAEMRASKEGARSSVEAHCPNRGAALFCWRLQCLLCLASSWFMEGELWVVKANVNGA